MATSLVFFSYRIVASAWNSFWKPENEDLRNIYRRQFPQVESNHSLLSKLFTRSAARMGILLGISAFLAVVDYTYNFGQLSCAADDCFFSPGFLPIYVYTAFTCLALIAFRLLAARSAKFLFE